MQVLRGEEVSEDLGLKVKGRYMSDPKLFCLTECAF